MPPGSEAPRVKRAASVRHVDLFSALPDELIVIILSFLPSRDAVQTCLVARRWRNLWKKVRVLRVTDDDDYDSSNDLNKFVNHLLILRDQSQPLDVVDIKSYGGEEEEDFEESYRYIDVWIQYALSHRVQALRVCMVADEVLPEEDDIERWPLPNMFITSKYLTKLELIHAVSEDRSLDFSSCPVLNDLKMGFCALLIDQFVSPSLKNLSITYCYFESDARARISAPSLISLELVDCHGRTPLLDNMPLLVSAFVRLRNCCDCCANMYETGDCGDGSCEGCSGSNIGNNTVLLEGLSSSTNLELTAVTAAGCSHFTLNLYGILMHCFSHSIHCPCMEFIFRKDLARCPVFSKLKTLLLNDWCITANLGPLICFLQHSPTLEKLTLQLPEIAEDLVGVEGSYDMKKKTIVLNHLTVEVKCHKLDERVSKIREALGSCGIPPEQIKILQPPKLIESRCNDPWPSGSLSFEQKRT